MNTLKTRFIRTAFIASILLIPLVSFALSNVTVTQPDGSVAWRGIQDVTWTDASVAPPYDVFYSSDFSTFQNLISNVLFTTTEWDTSTVADETYQVRVENDNGEFGISSTVTIDNTPPVSDATIDPASPDGANGWYVTQPEITLSCDDGSGSGCGNTFYSFDGNPYTPYTAPFLVPEGEHTLTFYSEDQAVDKFGDHNEETPQIFSIDPIKVDLTDPAVSLYKLDGEEDDAYFNPSADSVEIFIEATEPVEYNKIGILNDSLSEVKFFTQIGVFQATTTKVWDGTGNTGDGGYTLRVNIEDRAGRTVNNLDLSPHVIVIDTQDPTISNLVDPQADEVYRPGSLPPLEFFVDDPAPGSPLSCSYTVTPVGGSPVNTSVPCSAGATTTDSILLGDLVDGRNEVFVTVTDAAGNSADSDTVSFVFDDDNELTVNDDATPPADFDTIQEGFNKALIGHTVFVYDGSYTLNTSTFTLNKSITITGESEAGVQIDGSGIDGYGIAPEADNITLENFTLDGPAAGGASGNYGIKASGISNFTARNVTVQGSLVSEFDLNTVNTGLLENVTADGFSSSLATTTGGVGIALSHSNDITLRNVTTLNNKWGGVGLFDTSSGSTDDITFEGANSFGEANKVYIDAEHGFGVSGVILPGFFHSVRNDTFRDASDGRGPDFTFLQMSEADAISFALALVTPDDSYVQTLNAFDQSLPENHFIVGDGMVIQTAIDHADPDALVEVRDGDYNEDVNINVEGLTLSGDGYDSTSTIYGQGAGEPGALVVSEDGVTVDGFLIIGSGVSAIRISGARNNVTIQNNKAVAATGKNALLTDGGQSNHTIQNNIFEGDSSQLVYVNGNVSVATPSTNVNFISNEFGGTATGPLLGQEADDSFITGNTFTGVTSYAGIEIWGNNVTVSGNTLTGSGSGAGVLVASLSSGTVVDDSSDINTISGFGTGIQVDGTSVAVNLNNISGNTFGLDNTSGVEVDAERNWWGTARGPLHSTNPLGTGDEVSDDVDFSPFCTTIPVGGVCDLGSIGPLEGFILEFDPNPVSIPDSSELTITAVDADDIVLVNDNRDIKITGGGTTKFDGVFGPALENLTDGVFVSIVTDTTPGAVNIVVEDFLDSKASDGVLTFLGDETAPTVTHTPSDDATGVSVDADLYVDFSEVMDVTTINLSNIELRKYSDDSLVTLVDVQPANGNTRGILVLASGTFLEPNTQYYFVVTSDVKDLAGNSVSNPFGTGDKASHEFTTEELDDIVVTNIENPTTGEANDTYLDGWHYVFDVTVNNLDETDLSMKFEDWVNTAVATATVQVLGNTRLLLNEVGGPFLPSEAVIESGFSLGNDYSDQTPGTVDLTGIDLDAGLFGRQLELHVYVKIPTGTIPGFYGTTFGIQTQ